MIITNIDLKDFRNIETLSIEPDKGINIFYGRNAQGKTNILEAVYMGCTSRSHKSVKEKEMIRFQKEEAHIKLNLLKNEISYRIDIHIKKNKAKGIAVNGVPLRRASDLLGIANVVIFSPEDLSLIKNGPSERRRFIDSELCQLDKVYTHDLISYNRVIDQKNNLLKEKEPDLTVLSVLNEQIVKYGKEIIRQREEFIQKLGGIMKEKIFGDEEIEIIYEKNVEPEEMEHALFIHQERELRNCLSLIGPHRDDLCFKVNGNDLRHYGSQGQQRTAALTLKLSEIDLVERITGNKPVLLLDDVLSELDRSRQDMLLESLKQIQVFITCTGIDDLIERRFHMDKVFMVEKGEIKCQN